MSSWKLRTGLLLSSTLVAAAAVAAMPQPTETRDARAAQLLDPAYMARGLCGPQGKRQSAFFKPALVLAAAGQTAAAPAAEDEPSLWNFLGDLTYPVTTKDEMAQSYFDQGLRLSYAFNHPEAIRAFRQAQKIDPTCAMCYWGEAFALGPNINAPMDPSAVGPAFAAASKALALAGGASEREQALIAALAKRYSPDPAADRTVLNAAYADAMAEAAARFPDDHEIATLYASSVMDVSPWDYWEADRSTPKGRSGKAIEAVEKVLAADPDHPFAIHLYIHLVEASTTPERAEPYADRLGATMPGAGHMVHMPGHIYFRVGRYLDALASNEAAVAADEFLFQQVEDPGLYAYSYYPHNVHFLLESARLAGDAETAVAAAEKLPGTMSDEVIRAVPWVQVIKASPYFAHAQFSAPEATLAIPDPGDDFPYVKATWHYARGVASAARGDAAAAQAEAAAIAAIGKATDWTPMIEGGVPVPDLLEIAQHVIAGRIAQAKGDHAGAAGAFEKAAAIQDALPYFEPPYWYYPVHQSRGGALLQAGRAEEAERAFQRALMTFPNNAWSLYGLMEAQKARGDAAAANQTAALLEKAWAGGDRRPDLSRL